MEGMCDSMEWMCEGVIGMGWVWRWCEGGAMDVEWFCVERRVESLLTRLQS